MIIRKCGMVLLLVVVCMLTACGVVQNANYKDAISPVHEGKVQISSQNSTLQNDIRFESNEIEDDFVEGIPDSTVRLSEAELAILAQIQCCEFNMEEQSLVYELTLECMPETDDTYVYLLGYQCYEEDIYINRDKVLQQQYKGETVHFSIPYERRFLFMEFVPAVLLGGEFVPIAPSRVMSNPEILAPNQREYPEISSKKGLLIDPATIGTPELDDLGIKHAVYNIPLSHILGESDDTDYPMIEYEYDGRTYLFNGKVIHGYDSLFLSFQEAGMCTTAIVLNDWNEVYPELIHPLARKRGREIYYHAFNTVEEEGVHTLEAVAMFLAERYSDGMHGMVHNWVIANEVNQNKTWNYMDTDDLDFYATEFEKGFRIFYQAIKSRYSNARVYFSIDNKWNEANHNDAEFFNGKVFLEKMNEVITAKGNYDWGLAIHPYLEPMTQVIFWKGEYDKSVTAEYLTIMNLSTLTEVLERDSFRNAKGVVRDVMVTELGFTSRKSEKLQAVAFTYCYLILENNPYISAFLMNRQTDAKEETKQGLAFGIYKSDMTPKYLHDAFQYIDTDKRSEYVMYMLEQIGAKSVAEAVSWAK